MGKVLDQWLAVLHFLCVICVGGPSGFGLFADWLLSRGGEVSFGATANCKGRCGGVPIVTDIA